VLWWFTFKAQKCSGMECMELTQSDGVICMKHENCIGPTLSRWSHVSAGPRLCCTETESANNHGMI